MSDDPVLQALIWKIDRFATRDGPGIRTNFYFKGCPLHCLWCSNPEGQRREREPGFSGVMCTRCGLCAEACPEGALSLQDGVPAVNDACTGCGACASVCPSGALFIYGKLYDLPAIMDVVERDRHLYRRSGGGITCSGGEPCAQGVFLHRLFRECRRFGVHTALETCGYAEKTLFRKILDVVDWLFFDLKHLDFAEHKRLTGKENAMITENLRTASSVLGERGKTLVVRQVVVPGCNDGDNITALGKLAGQLPYVDSVELLPYHAFGAHKYPTLRRAYDLVGVSPADEETLGEYAKKIENFGVRCVIGGI